MAVSSVPLTLPQQLAHRRRRFWRIGIAAVVVAILAVLPLTVLRPAPAAIDVFRVERGRVEETVVNSKAGTVQSRHRASLNPEVAGRVATIPVRKGDRVRRGAVLVTLDDAGDRAQHEAQARALDATRAAEREACDAASLAARELARYERLAASGAVALDTLDQMRNKRDAATSGCEGAGARVRQAQSTVHIAGLNRAKAVLRAPFDGVVANVSIEVGEWVSPATVLKPSVELIDDHEIYVSAPIDEADINRLRTGLPVRITFDAFAGRSFPGRITRVAPYVVSTQEQNRTIDIEVDLEDTAFARTLPPGTSADVAVLIDSRNDVLRVPADAVNQDGNALVVRDGILAVARVEAGLRNWEFIEVVGGLRAGDLVMVSHGDATVTAGSRVRVRQEVRRD